MAIRKSDYSIKLKGGEGGKEKKGSYFQVYSPSFYNF